MNSTHRILWSTCRRLRLAHVSVLVACMIAALLVRSAAAAPPSAGKARADVLLEAEAFARPGGWVVDPQYIDVMGSPYLLAHGLGRPVADASTDAHFPEGGAYRLWVRTKDWVPSHHPGVFRVTIDGRDVPRVFGDHGRNWSWQDGGIVDVPAGRVVVGLRDLTGFDGRCDALYFCRNLRARPPNGGPRSRPWRKRLLGMPAEPPSAGSYDVVVVGGGIAGCSAALAAGRLGLRVALVQNRPVLGGNASSEIGITPRGETRSIVNEVSGRDRERVMRSERKIDLNLGWHVFSARRKGRRIVSVDAANIATGGEQRFTAKAFIDCTGVAAVGMLVGADTRLGREARAEFGEGLAPERADALHHGSTIIFSTKSTGVPTTFPDVPWATEVSRGYAGLGGQVTADHDNEGGLTHFWEYGQRMDPTRDAEDVRDHLLRAIYGTFATAKRTKPEAANLVLDRVGFVPAGGEARRLIGDYILTEKDIRSGRVFADAAAVCSGHFCLHYPGDQYDFRLGDWKWIPVPTYTVPLRCLYSRNVDNLLMAGKHISVTHIAASSTKTMLNGGQMGVAAGAAAFLCVRHGVTPRDVARRHVDELQDILVGRGPSGKALRDRLEGMTGNDDATP